MYYIEIYFLAQFQQFFFEAVLTLYQQGIAKEFVFFSSWKYIYVIIYLDIKLDKEPLYTREEKMKKVYRSTLNHPVYPGWKIVPSDQAWIQSFRDICSWKYLV